MRALLEKIPYSRNRSFNILEYCENSFQTPWHYHPELELILFLEGSGTRYVGDDIGPLLPGDLLLLGGNLPHYWGNAPEEEGGMARSVVFHFSPQFVGDGWLERPEMRQVAELFERASRGLRFTGRYREAAARRIQELPRLTPYKGLMELLDLLQYLAVVPREHSIPLASIGYDFKLADRHDDRMKSVVDHILEHYRNPELCLDEVVEVAKMSRAGFCRYFKKLTRRTFSTYVSEVRVGHACTRLIQTRMSVAEIAFEAGFNNLSYFNRTFRQLRGVSPSDYRKKHAKRG